MKTQFDHFNFPLNFSWNLWNIVSRRIKKVCDFCTCPRKFEIKVQPIDLLSWINFRGPVLNQGSFLQNFSLPSLSTRSEPRNHKVFWGSILEPPEKFLTPKQFRGPLLTSLRVNSWELQNFMEKKIFPKNF